MKWLKPVLALVSTLVAATACTQADILNFTIPTKGYTVHKDIDFGTNGLKLDVYVPDKPDAAKTVVVFYYGGAWQTGSPNMYLFLGEAMTSKGYTLVVPDYRKYPQAMFPAFMDDAAQSVVWAHEHIAEYGADASHMYLMGHSAGGHMATLLALDGQYLKKAGGDAKWIKGVIGMAGPYDFTPDDPKIIAVFSKATPEEFLPIHHVHRGAPPMMILSGEKDEEVGARNGRNLSAKLRENDDTVVEKTYPGVGHIGIILSMAYRFRDRAPTLEDIDHFIRETNAR